MRARLPVLLARVRMPMLWAAAVSLVTSAVLDVGRPWLGWVGLGLLVVGLAVYFRLGTVRRPPVEVAPPVAGRWVAINSPASRVPSHGVHAYGQTYAIDLVHEPTPGARPAFGATPGMAPATDFPAFGQPVFAPAAGTVVRVHDRERDHRARNSWLGVAWLVVESQVRELAGPGRILGNHVVLDLGGGVYAAMAHLRRGSVRVRPGARVAAGQQLAECGNSGNSSEPHLHFQLMDRPGALVAAGLPFRFAARTVEGDVRDGVPVGGGVFVATPATAPGAARDDVTGRRPAT